MYTQFCNGRGKKIVCIEVIIEDKEIVMDLLSITPSLSTAWVNYVARGDVIFSSTHLMSMKKSQTLQSH